MPGEWYASNDGSLLPVLSAHCPTHDAHSNSHHRVDFRFGDGGKVVLEVIKKLRPITFVYVKHYPVDEILAINNAELYRVNSAIEHIPESHPM